MFRSFHADCTATIDCLGPDGAGIAHLPEGVVRVPGSLPGERVTVEIVHRGQRHLQGRLVEVVVAAPARVASPCSHFLQCGGCDLQHLAYGEQLAFKRERVERALASHGVVPRTPVHATLPSPAPLGYRAFAKLVPAIRDGRVVVGSYAPGSHRVVPMTGCPVHHPLVEAVADRLPALLERHGFLERPDALRYILIRAARSEERCLVVLVTRSPAPPALDALAAALHQLPPVAAVYHNVNDAPGNAILGPYTMPLGPGEPLREQLGPISLEVAPDAFAQINPAQAERLYARAADLAGPDDAVLLDLYCGVGGLALTAAPRARLVIGIETVPAAVERARANARYAHLTNTRFLVADATTAAAELAGEGLRPTVVFLNPPRKGCTPPLLDTLGELAPSRMVYVSCNPDTLARDLRLLVDRGFVVDEVYPVDMFPQTRHVETVVKVGRADRA